MAEEEMRGEEIDSRSVFVRGLPFGLTDSQFEGAFSDVGPVRRAFTVKEKVTNRHRGFGFVEFALAEDAQRAVELKNGTPMEGRKLKVEIAMRKKKSERKPRGKEGTPDAAEKETVKKAPVKRERGSDENLQGNKAEEMVRPNKKRRLSQPGNAAKDEGSLKQKPARTVVIGNLTEVKPIVALVEKLGTVESIEKSTTDDFLKTNGLFRDGCKQSAIVVVFKSVRAARETVATFHNQKLGNNLVWARQLGGEGPKLKQLRLIVRNLPFKVTEEMLREAFSPAGFVWELTIPRKPDGQCKGFAFVTYTSKQDAEKAIKDLNGTKMAKRTMAVDWAVAKTEYESLKSTGNQDDSDASELTASEESEEEENGDVDDESNGEPDELDLAQKVLGKVVEAGGEQPIKADSVHEKTEKKHEKKQKAKEELAQRLEADAKAKKQNPKEELAVKQPPTETDVTTSNSESGKDVLQRTVFMRNLPPDAKVHDLRSRFSQYGEINAFRVVNNRSTGKPKGTAFVEFATREGAEAVVKAAKGAEQGSSDIVIGGLRTIVYFAVDKNAAQQISIKTSDEKDDRRNLSLLKEGLIEAGTSAAEGVSKGDLQRRQTLQHEKSTKLRSPTFHVSRTRLAFHNFPKSLDEKKIKQLFIDAVVSRATKQTPVVKQVKLMSDDKGSRGSGFVEFTEHQHALVALRVLNNNPETFSADKRPIVEFSIENMSKLKKRAERLALHKSGQGPQKAQGIGQAGKSKEVPDTRKRKRASEGDDTAEDQSKPAAKKNKREKASPGKRKRGEKDDKEKKVDAPAVENGVKKQKPKNKQQDPKNTEASQQKDDGKKKKNKRRKTDNEVEDKLDKLVSEYRTKYYDTREPEARAKTLENIKRWFE